MRQLIKYFLWMGVGCLIFGFESAWAFSLLGPVANGGDAWQVTDIGYNPLPATDSAYGITDGNLVGPKNLNEGYRRNTPVMYYAFSPSFSDFFGSNGEFAVQQAYDLLNGALNGHTNAPLYLYAPNQGFVGDSNNAPSITLGLANSLDSYSANLAEFPLKTEYPNYLAAQLSLQDVKSFTLGIMAEELGLADPVRYTWAMHDRFHTGNVPCPAGMSYSVVQRNFDILPSQPNQVQYSPYVNDELYNYAIIEFCDAPNIEPPKAAPIPYPANPLVDNPPVASGAIGLDFLGTGKFYTGLTRDDVAGLRFLYSTNNYDNPSPAYRESAAAGSQPFNYSNPQLLYTSNYNELVATAMTNDPATIAGLFPGIQFIYLTNYWSNVVFSSMTFVTNFPIGGPSGQGFVGLQTNYSTNLVDFFKYSFGNVVVNSNYLTTTYRNQTITVGPPIGSPVGSAFVTNVTYSSPFQSNIPSGDYFVISNGSCPPNIILTLQTNVNIVTNLIAGTTNSDGSSIVRNLVYFYTNYVFEVNYCTLGATNGSADYQGIGRMQFIRVQDDNYDYLSGQFITPITNQYTMLILTNHNQHLVQTFQRVITTPDFLFSATDLATGPNAAPGVQNGLGRGENFNQANIYPTLAGPGTIDPPSEINFNKSGPVFINSTAFLRGPSGAQASYLWGSFDGTTNAPIVYPNGTSLLDLANQATTGIEISPGVLPDGTNGASYSVTMSATGNNPPFTWSLAPLSSGLPPGLTLSASGIISGTPTQGGTFDGIIIQASDSETPPLAVQMTYSLTIH